MLVSWKYRKTNATLYTACLPNGKERVHGNEHWKTVARSHFDGVPHGQGYVLGDILTGRGYFKSPPIVEAGHFRLPHTAPLHVTIY